VASYAAVVTERTLPTGTITFLASDMEGSTRLVQAVGPAVFRGILEQHNAILRTAFETRGAVERGTQGDSFLVMFREAPAALAAAAEAQLALSQATWPLDTGVRVRMGLHTGVATLGGDDYVGIDVHRAARIASAAHGGQVLLSDATRALAEPDLPPGTTLRALGEHKLRDVARPERLSQLVIDGVPSQFPPIQTGDAAAGNLPSRLTAFIGREAELAELGRLIQESRLITLTGTGGTGKTSLAIEFASAHARAFPQGAWLVRLDALSDPALVAPAIAGALGLLESPGQSISDRLLEYLGDRSILLVLDNFEQVLPAASLVGDLLQASPGLTILVTSRAALRLSAEQEFPVAPLALPGPIEPLADAFRSPAVQLFVERARRVRPDYTLTPEDAPAVAEICRRLDGLPLGIELAASRVALLPPRAIAARLAEQLELPGAAARDVPARQRSMERAIAWSYDLLEPHNQRLLDRLSVFRGGCRLEEAELVCGPAVELGVDVLDGLAVLVEHSLVQAAPGPDGARFRLLETIRAYAGARLGERGETAEIERRHATAYLDLVEAAASHLPGGDQRVLLDRLTAEHDNLRAALAWTIDHDETELAMRLGVGSWRFWQLRGHIEEGRTAMNRVLAMPGADAATRWRVRALEADGGLRYWSADLPGADARYREQLELARRLDDVAGTADALFNQEHTRSLLEGSTEDAGQLIDEAERLYYQIGDERSAARLEWTRLNLALARGESGLEDRMLAARRRFEALGDDWYVSLTLGTLAWSALARGDFHNALRWWLGSLNMSHTMGDIATVTVGFRAAAIVVGQLGMLREAITILGAFEALCARYGVRPPALFEEITPGLEVLPIGLEDDPGATARGAAMSFDEAVDYVTSVVKEVLARAE
jgi:predicted ATPase/class 3 adenylate cyclase